MWQSFVCAMTAAVTLQAMDPFRSGKLVMFQVKHSTDWARFEMIPYALLGVFGVSKKAARPWCHPWCVYTFIFIPRG